MLLKQNTATRKENNMALTHLATYMHGPTYPGKPPKGMRYIRIPTSNNTTELFLEPIPTDESMMTVNQLELLEKITQKLLTDIQSNQFNQPDTSVVIKKK